MVQIPEYNLISDDPEENKIRLLEYFSQAIKLKQYKKAAIARALYQSSFQNQKHSLSLPDDYQIKDDALMVRLILSAKPIALAGLNKETLSILRFQSAIDYLATNKVSGIDHPEVVTNIKYDARTCRKLLRENAYFRKEIIDAGSDHNYLRPVIHHMNDEHVCAACQEMCSKTYTFEDIPELPYTNCECEHGCRCGLSFELA